MATFSHEPTHRRRLANTRSTHWRGVVLFTARTTKGMRFDNPEVLTAENPALQEAAAALGMPVAI